jgi:hypothetical protein
MRSSEKRPDCIDNSSLDRLVDGDLPETERHELLLRLESDPEGWRRCALAFLEHQAWSKALATVAPADSMPAPGPVPARLRTSWMRRASIAATVLASTFAGGFAAGGLAKMDRPVEVANANPPGSASIPKSSQPDEIREVGSLQLVDGSAGESPPDRFPIRSGPGLDDQWLRSQPPSVPEYVRVQLERQGYKVAERRKLVSFELEDGRRVSIPVDEVAVGYVGQQPL